MSVQVISRQRPEWGIVGGLVFAQFWFSDRIALYAIKAQMVTHEEKPQLHGIPSETLRNRASP